MSDDVRDLFELDIFNEGGGWLKMTDNIPKCHSADGQNRWLKIVDLKTK